MEPVMIRVYQGGNRGATAFFRNRTFLRTFLDALANIGKPRVRVLVHAASIGAEPYSLALYYLQHYREKFDLQILATDINAQFLEAARAGAYGAEVGRGLTDEERGWFVTDGRMLRVPDSARAMVQFLPPMDFVRTRPDGQFEAVMIMNALTYVSAPEQRLAIGQAAGQSQNLLALTAFHPDSIRADIDDAAFEPLLANHEAIHNGWGDRLSGGPVDPSSSAYSWKLPPYDGRRADCAWRYGAIFRRRGPEGFAATAPAS